MATLSPQIQLKQSQVLQLTQAMRQSLQILQCSGMELHETLQELVLNNPLLQYEPAQAVIFPNGSPRDDDEEGEFEPAAAESFSEYLMTQASSLPIDDRNLALVQFLIYNLDDRGFLMESLDALLEQIEAYDAADQADISLADLSRALQYLQSLEPVGVGARDLAECLYLQLNAMKSSPSVELAKVMVTKGRNALAKADLRALEKICQASEDAVKKAYHLLTELSMAPAQQWQPQDTVYMVPDVVVRMKGDELLVSLNPAARPKLSMNAEYEEIIAQHKKEVQRPYQDAKNMISQLEMRFQTILRVATVVMNEQKRFVQQGVDGLVPLTLKQVAIQIPCHVSTVSRAIHQKYVDTPWGVYELRFFFSSGLVRQLGTTVTQEVSAKAIQAKIQAWILDENKALPISDQQIQQRLEKEGIMIARRTVAKYREALGIASSMRRRSKHRLES